MRRFVAFSSTTRTASPLRSPSSAGMSLSEGTFWIPKRAVKWKALPLP
jgi:hypothetical protein